MALPPAYPQTCQQNPGITSFADRAAGENTGQLDPPSLSSEPSKALIKKSAKR